MNASIDGTVIAQSNDTIVVEGNHYFPPGSIDQSLLIPSAKSTHCRWKGDASYYDVIIEGHAFEHVVWYYPHTFEEAKHIESYVAFGSPVVVSAD